MTGADRGEGGARKVSNLRSLGVLFAALALFVQSFIVQPHIDWQPFDRDASAHVTSAHTDAAGGGAPGVCIICQAAALSGALTLAATPTLSLVERSLFNKTPALRQRVVCRALSHSWQSRAPPISI